MKTHTFAEAMEARAEGKRVKPAHFSEYKEDGWIHAWSIANADACQWHIETPPTQVPWDCPEDVPMVVRFRPRGCKGISFPQYISPSGIVWSAEQSADWERLAKTWEHTTDGINWKPCTKEQQ